MGQYRQWLHYRGIDQLLRSQLAVSEHELEQLQAQVEVLGKQVFSMENEVFRALIVPRQDAQNYPKEPDILYPEKQDIQLEDEIAELIIEEQEDEIVIEEVEDEDTATISPALLAWSRLPNFDTEMIEEPDVNGSTQTPEASPPQPDEQLLPADINAFIDAYYPTNPQIKVPWWLHNIALSDQEAHETAPVDQQSERADHLVQRWFERWGQRPMKTKRSQEDQTS